MSKPINLTEIVPKNTVQKNLFDSIDRSKHAKLMEVLGLYNSGFTTNRLGWECKALTAAMKAAQEHCSQHYTTSLREIIKVSAISSG